MKQCDQQISRQCIQGSSALRGENNKRKQLIITTADQYNIFIVRNFQNISVKEGEKDSDVTLQQ